MKNESALLMGLGGNLRQTNVRSAGLEFGVCIMT